jgi:hypothetical protein
VYEGERERERERGVSEWLVRKVEEVYGRTRSKVRVEKEKVNGGHGKGARERRS